MYDLALPAPEQRITLHRPQSTSIVTSQGHVVDFLKPDPSQIHIGDIATGLAREARFTGQTRLDREPYNVALHSLLTAAICRVEFNRPDLVGQALLHDASEAYLGDLNSPAKRLCPEYKVIEKRLMKVIMQKYLDIDTYDPVVKQADWMAYCIERAQLMPAKSVEIDEAAGRKTVLPTSGVDYEVPNLNAAASRRVFIAAVQGMHLPWMFK